MSNTKMLEQLKGGFWVGMDEFQEELISMGMYIETAGTEAIEVIYEVDGEECYATLELITAGDTVIIKKITQ